MIYWLSWYATKKNGAFELHSPWWVSGGRGADRARTICAAIKADSEKSAREIIYKAHDKRPKEIEFRFIEAKPPDFNPFCGRFPRADWMKWDDKS